MDSCIVDGFVSRPDCNSALHEQADSRKVVELKVGTSISIPRRVFRKSRRILKFLKPSGSTNQPLFDGNDEFFREHLPGCVVYGEYGVGDSTIWVSRNTDARIIGVDSSLHWIKNVKNHIGNSSRVELKYVDVGPVGDWGRPAGYSRSGNFLSYLEGIWSEENKPDVVLIDGRFRVACFLTSLLRAKAGTIIIFDDYVRRPHYHVVEQFLRPLRSNDRQALFRVPEDLPLDLIEAQRAKFEFVFD